MERGKDKIKRKEKKDKTEREGGKIKMGRE